MEAFYRASVGRVGRRFIQEVRACARQSLLRWFLPWPCACPEARAPQRRRATTKSASRRSRRATASCPRLRQDRLRPQEGHRTASGALQLYPERHRRRREGRHPQDARRPDGRRGGHAVGLSQIVARADRAQRARRRSRTTTSSSACRRRSTRSGSSLARQGRLQADRLGRGRPCYRYFSKKPVTRPSDLKTCARGCGPRATRTKAMWTRRSAAPACRWACPRSTARLQTGMVDAVDLDRARDRRAAVAHEAEVRHQPDARRAASAAMIMTSDKWDSIPADVKATLEEQITHELRGRQRATCARTTRRPSRSCCSAASPARTTAPKARRNTRSSRRRCASAWSAACTPKELLDRVMQIARGGNS